MQALTQQRRSGRTLFLAFLGAVYVAILSAMPIMHSAAPALPLTGALEALPPFEEVDRNHDGFIDAKEAAALPGFSALFERTGMPLPKRLDKVRYARALAFFGERQ